MDELVAPRRREDTNSVRKPDQVNWAGNLLRNSEVKQSIGPKRDFPMISGQGETVIPVFEISERLPQGAIGPRALSDVPSPLNDLNARCIPVEQF